MRIPRNVSDKIKTFQGRGTTIPVTVSFTCCSRDKNIKQPNIVNIEHVMHEIK